MIWNKGMICPAELENGIVVDYVNGAFIMALKDDVWQDYERTAFQRHQLHLSFLYERVCALFLFAVEDAIETSDASFDIHACEEASTILAIPEGACYRMEIYLIDQHNSIVEARGITLSRPATKLMQEAFQKQMATPYDEEGFDRALLKIQGSGQPFELEERADFHEIF